MKILNCPHCRRKPLFTLSDRAPQWPVQLIHSCIALPHINIYHRTPQRAVNRWNRRANDEWIMKVQMP